MARFRAYDLKVAVHCVALACCTLRASPPRVVDAFLLGHAAFREALSLFLRETVSVPPALTCKAIKG